MFWVGFSVPGHTRTLVGTTVRRKDVPRPVVGGGRTQDGWRSVKVKRCQLLCFVYYYGTVPVKSTLWPGAPREVVPVSRHFCPELDDHTSAGGSTLSTACMTSVRVEGFFYFNSTIGEDSTLTRSPSHTLDTCVRLGKCPWYVLPDFEFSQHSGFPLRSTVESMKVGTNTGWDKTYIMRFSSV